MRDNKLKQGIVGMILAILIVSLAGIGQAPFVGLTRNAGQITSRGDMIELTAGAAVVAGNALYLDATGKVQKLTAAQANNFVGIAYNSAASGATVQVQYNGVATAICDGNWTINDKVGGTGITPAGTLKTLASTLTASGAVVTSGATTGTVTSGAGTITVTTNGTGATQVVMGDTNATGTSVLTSTATTGALTSTAITQPTIAGDPVTSRVAGRALTACTDTGTGTVLLLPQ